MNIEKSHLSGLKAIRELPTFGDERGSFQMWWRSDWDDPDIASIEFRQLNVASNLQRGVTRGSHVAPWDKYAHPLYGTGFAVIVDARAGSPTFGEVDYFELTATDALFIPRGCGHAYQAVTDLLIYGYGVNELWANSSQEQGVSLLDSRFASVPWPIEDREAWVMSDKDRTAPSFHDVFG